MWWIWMKVASATEADTHTAFHPLSVSSLMTHARHNEAAIVNMHVVHVVALKHMHCTSHANTQTHCHAAEEDCDSHL